VVYLRRAGARLVALASPIVLLGSAPVNGIVMIALAFECESAYM